MRTVLMVLGVVLSLVASGRAAAQAGDGPKPILIRNVTIIDVAAGVPIPNQTVLIKGGVIDSITPASDTAAAPAGTTVIDAAGLYLIPGLFDAHVHYISPETYGRLMLANGITFVRDLGNATETIIPLRDQLNSGEVLGPRMIATGAIIDGDPPVWPFSEACDTEEEARAAVRKLHGAGVDQIKVYSRLRPEVYRAAADEARSLNLKVVGHIPGACTIEDAIAAGQTSVEHLSRLEATIARLLPESPDARPGAATGFAQMRAWARLGEADPAALRAELKKIADAGVVQCPTLVVMAGIAETADRAAADKNPLLAYVPTGIRSFWAGQNYAAWAEQAGQLVAPMQRMLAAMHETGVPLMVGTDLANPYVFAGHSLHREMELWAEAGIPAADILRAATLTPAVFCGVGEEYGTVAAGKRASLVLLGANPLEDIRNAKQIRAVLLDGRLFDEPSLAAMLEEIRGEVAASTPSAAAGEVDLSLPGEVLHRGRYKAKFGQFDAGIEDFVISRDADGGYHVKSHSQPSGGFQKPALISIHAGPDFAFRSGSYRELTKDPMIAAYALANGRFEAHDMRARGGEGGEAPPPQTVEAPAAGTWLFSPPITAADFLTLHHAALEPGQTRTYTAIGFGFAQPAWHLAATPMELTRHEDTTLTRAGAPVPARRYTSTMTTPMGQFKGEVWTSAADGLLLKSTLVMPFGTVTIELE